MIYSWIQLYSVLVSVACAGGTPEGVGTWGVFHAHPDVGWVQTLILIGLCHTGATPYERGKT